MYNSSQNDHCNNNHSSKNSMFNRLSKYHKAFVQEFSLVIIVLMVQVYRLAEVI